MRQQQVAAQRQGGDESQCGGDQGPPALRRSARILLTAVHAGRLSRLGATLAGWIGRSRSRKGSRGLVLGHKGHLSRLMDPSRRCKDVDRALDLTRSHPSPSPVSASTTIATLLSWQYHPGRAIHWRVFFLPLVKGGGHLGSESPTVVRVRARRPRPRAIPRQPRPMPTPCSCCRPARVRTPPS
jgi:hypothetical protein